MTRTSRASTTTGPPARTLPRRGGAVRPTHPRPEPGTQSERACKFRIPVAVWASTSAFSWAAAGWCGRTSSCGSSRRARADGRSRLGRPSCPGCTSWPAEPRWARSRRHAGAAPGEGSTLLGAAERRRQPVTAWVAGASARGFGTARVPPSRSGPAARGPRTRRCLHAHTARALAYGAALPPKQLGLALPSAAASPLGHQQRRI